MPYIISDKNMEIVSTDCNYSFCKMENDIDMLKQRYPFLEIGTAGKSILGKKLYYLKLGNGPNKVFYNAAHHSLEWITSVLLMKFSEDFLNAYSKKIKLRNYSIEKIWDNTSIYIMPMVNPDGVNLVLGILKPEDFNIKNEAEVDLKSIWNANICGVDLNRNYPALWNLAKAQEPQLGIKGPGPTRYGGPFPLSEPETSSVIDFTRKNNFQLVIAFHSQGSEIYWKFQNHAPKRALTIAKNFSKLSGYSVSEAPVEASYAGYKDWFIQEYKRPGYTIEVGLGKNPLPINQFSQIYNDNIEILLTAAISCAHDF